MLEYLDKLVEERKWEEALAYAEQLLSEVDDDPHKLLRLNVAILMSRQELGEYYGAQAIGQLCMKMAKDLCEWDLFGTTCLYLGTSAYCMGQYDAALAAWAEYLGHLSEYTPNPIVEAMVRYNLGTVYSHEENYQDALRQYTAALSAAQQANNPRMAHGIRHALIGMHIKLGHRSEVLKLLAQSLHYVHHGLEPSDKSDLSRFWHFVIRAEFALATGRYHRARRVALKGLSEGRNHHRLMTAFHMILARIARAEGNREEAIQHALSARIEAIACGRYDLELESADYMYQLLAEL